MNILLPSIERQKEISKILFDLDSKIEVNNQMIATLEELAATLFKRWFVDFEFPDENGNPYKSSGGKMVDSELGEIPEGWEIQKLEKLISVIDNRGKTPPLENGETDFPIIDVKTISNPNRIIDFSKALKFVNKETYDTWFRNGHPKHGDILMSTVGSIGALKIFLENKGTIAQNIVAFRTTKPINLYLYQYLVYHKRELVSYNIGSVQPSIKVTHIVKYNVVLPSESILARFQKITGDWTKKIAQLDLENRTLDKTRNQLMPKLLSGDLEV